MFFNCFLLIMIPPFVHSWNSCSIKDYNVMAEDVNYCSPNELKKTKIDKTDNVIKVSAFDDSTVEKLYAEIFTKTDPVIELVDFGFQVSNITISNIIKLVKTYERDTILAAFLIKHEDKATMIDVLVNASIPYFADMKTKVFNPHLLTNEAQIYELHIRNPLLSFFGSYTKAETDKAELCLNFDFQKIMGVIKAFTCIEQNIDSEERLTRAELYFNAFESRITESKQFNLDFELYKGYKNIFMFTLKISNNFKAVNMFYHLEHIKNLDSYGDAKLLIEKAVIHIPRCLFQHFSILFDPSPLMKYSKIILTDLHLTELTFEICAQHSNKNTNLKIDTTLSLTNEAITEKIDSAMKGFDYERWKMWFKIVSHEVFNLYNADHIDGVKEISYKTTFSSTKGEKQIVIAGKNAIAFKHFCNYKYARCAQMDTINANTSAIYHIAETNFIGHKDAKKFYFEHHHNIANIIKSFCHLDLQVIINSLPIKFKLKLVFTILYKSHKEVPVASVVKDGSLFIFEDTFFGPCFYDQTNYFFKIVFAFA